MKILIIIVCILSILILIAFMWIKQISKIAYNMEHSVKEIHKDLEIALCRHDIHIDIIKQYETGIDNINTDIYFKCTECNLEYRMNIEDIKDDSKEQKLYTEFIKLKHKYNEL